MSVFACLNLGYQPPSCFSEVANTASDEAFPPFLLIGVGPWWPFPCPHTDKDAEVTPGILVDNGFFQNLRRRVVFSGSLVNEDTLANLNRLEGKAGG